MRGMEWWNEWWKRLRGRSQMGSYFKKLRGASRKSGTKPINAPHSEGVLP